MLSLIRSKESSAKGTFGSALLEFLCLYLCHSIYNLTMLRDERVYPLFSMHLIHGTPSF